jgi:GntR family transcriptional regulator, transcriptional repressor for pyruvate dehydrogenase complex
MPLNAVRTQRTFEAISEQIRAQVRSGVLKIGDRLPNERELARTLEVSRHAVRESLRVLESVGLVELRKGATGGAFIAEGRPGAVADVMQGMYYSGGISLEQLTEARLWIESVVVRVACARADAAAYEALEENVRLAEKETRAGNLVAKTQLNIEFHTLLAATTGNPVLTMVMGAVMNILREFIGTIGSVMGMDVIHSRRRLLKHLRAGDADKGVAEMERHLKVLHRHYLEAAVAAKKSDKPKRSAKHVAKR